MILLSAILGCSPEVVPPPPSPPSPPPLPITAAAEFEVPDPRQGEVRGVWVTRWSYRSPEDVDQIFADLHEAGFTHVLFQVRGQFDAYYHSQLEPWAAGLTGQLGRDPGWDPLQVAVEAAEDNALELHAWVNVFTLWPSQTVPRSVGVPHPLQVHPDWKIRDRSGRSRHPRHHYQFASPGHPEVQAHLVEVVADIAGRYDIDGIHLDYIRYPGRDFGYDDASVQAAGEVADFDAWRRHQIVSLVQAMDAQVDIPLTAATWGIYEDRWGWRVPGGRDEYHQDSREMLRAGSLRAIAPMIYWPVQGRRGQRLDFATLAVDHVRSRGTGQVWAGINADKLRWEQVADCVRAARRAHTDGVVLFEYLALRDKGWLPRLRVLFDEAMPEHQRHPLTNLAERQSSELGD
ncbi:MAG: family 10 glycosylhydrolase [Myxococcota bacterium]